MNVLFIGGDKRYISIINDFINKGYNVDLVGYSKLDTKANKLKKLELKKYSFIVLPMSGVGENYTVNSLDGNIKIDENIFKAISNTTVFTGLVTNPLENIKDKISFIEDEDIKKKNDIITVDGIIEELKDKDTRIICILGYGNIGKKLVKKLKDYNYLVGIKDGEQFKEIEYKSFYTNDRIYFSKILTYSTVIINTVPENIIDERLVNYINGYFLDIASYPYGIKPELTKGINYKLYSGIPANYNPEEAGKILLKKINNTIGGNL